MSLTQSRPITKLIARLVKQYNLSSDLCPHLNIKRSEGALQFLLHKRYVDGSLSKYLSVFVILQELILFRGRNMSTYFYIIASLIGVASWREMVREAVGNDAKLHTDLVRMLIASDVQEALYWAKEYDIPKDKWPWAITYADEQNRQSNVSSS